MGVREGGGCEGGGQRESGYAILLSLLHMYFLVKKKKG